MVFKTTLHILLLACASAAVAAEHYVEGRPGAAQAVIDSGRVAPGDRIVLGSGRHGKIVIVGLQFKKTVTLMAEPGEQPILDRLEIRGGAGWRVEGLTVLYRRTGDENAALVTVKRGRNIVLERLTVASTRNSAGWSANEWQRNARSGISISGRDITVRKSRIRNVRNGISSTAEGARIEGNSIELFSGDGIRGLGDNSIYAGNTIDTCVDVADGHHDDGFQSWSTDEKGRPARGVVRNVRVENNVIKNGNHQLACQLQGIGLFGGMYENWTIADNTVIVDHWHGITVMGANRVKVLRNTVVDSRKGSPGPPWITITAHIDGRVARDSVIAGNVSQPWSGGGNRQFAQPQPGVRLSHNRVVASPEEAFQINR